MATSCPHGTPQEAQGPLKTYFFQELAPRLPRAQVQEAVDLESLPRRLHQDLCHFLPPCFLQVPDQTDPVQIQSRAMHVLSQLNCEIN